MDVHPLAAAWHRTIGRLPMKERRGSRPRCLQLTSGDREGVAERLTGLVAPYGRVDARRHVWMPQGFDAEAETRLVDGLHFLSPAQRDAVSTWWLAVRGGSTNIPNWDIASTATIDGREGLVLVEAKAHANELHRTGKPFRSGGAKPSSPENHERIGAAIAEASAALSLVIPGFALSRDSHYQLANRFAWAWKVASLGVPVLLVYLGFLRADEMEDQGPPLQHAEDWEQVVRLHARGIVPDVAWMEPLAIAGTPMRAIIRSVEIALPRQP